MGKQILPETRILYKFVWSLNGKKPDLVDLGCTIDITMYTSYFKLMLII